MQLVEISISKKDLQLMAELMFGDMVKAVVDIEKKIMVVDVELHVDAETFLLENESLQKNLWGINLYPALPEKEWLEFDSMINLRPTQGNRSRGVENPKIRAQIKKLVKQLTTS